jgi:hypothetical protein
MVKTLLNKLGNTIKKGISIGLAVASIAGCKPCVDTTSYPAKINHAPTSSLYVSATSGRIPLSVELKSDGTDKEGKSDIINYKLSIDEGNDGTIDETISQSTPIDVTRTFTKVETIKIYAECTDAEGLSDSKSTLVYASSSDIPTLDLSKINKDLIDGKTSTISLPSPADDDTSGDIPYISAEKFDSNQKVTPTLNGKQLTLQADAVSADTPYKIKLTFGSAAGGINTATLEGTIKNLCDISGNLESNEDYPNYTAKPGEVRLYDASNNSLGTITSTDGNFNIQANSPASQIKLQAKIGTDSYIRTVTLDGTKDYDLTNKIRVVPAPTSLGISPADFKEFMKEINFGEDLLSSNYGLKKWNLNNLKGIEILLQNPIISGSSFSQPQYNAIVSKITADDIGSYVKNEKDLSVLIKNEVGYEIINGGIVPKEGWIVVVPDNSISNAGETTDWYQPRNGSNATGIINGSLIKIASAWNGVDNEFVNNPVITHEFGHAFIAPDGEASTLFGGYTIMNPSDTPFIFQSPYIPKIADKKAGQIIYEPTYLPREKLDDILGTESL